VDEKEAKMRSLDHLSKDQVEQAFKVLHRLWTSERLYLKQDELPKQLQHLEEEEWIVLGAALEQLLDEQQENSLH
jgi:hypothetical protein